MPELAVQSKPESLCVLRLSAIGDTCHALAVIRRLQDNWPDVRITWIIGKTEASLMSDIPGIEFIIFDKSKGFGAYKDVRTQLAGKRFDLALCMHASMRANLLCRMIPAETRLGFDKARARDFQWLFTNRRVPPAAREHALEAMMSFATAAGAESRDLRWDIPLSDSAREFASRSSTRENRWSSSVPAAVSAVATTATGASTTTPRPFDILQQEHRCNVVLTGGNTRLSNNTGPPCPATDSGRPSTSWARPR